MCHGLGSLFFLFFQRSWGLVQVNYGPNKIELVTLPQKVNKEKKSHNSVL